MKSIGLADWPRCAIIKKVTQLLRIMFMCPGGLMDKVVDSGSTDAGSIPVRGAKRKEASIVKHSGNLYFLYHFYTNPITFPEF